MEKILPGCRGCGCGWLVSMNLELAGWLGAATATGLYGEKYVGKLTLDAGK